jgi:Tfp pilus assembly protein FimV
MDPPPQLRPQYTLDKLIPDIDLELPPLDMPEVDGERLLEEAKAALRAGDSEKARALALEALESRDPLIQSNAKALLERI